MQSGHEQTRIPPVRATTAEVITAVLGVRSRGRRSAVGQVPKA